MSPEDAVADGRVWEFATFRVDLADARLFRGDTALALRPKTFAVLRVLLERPGRLVSKQELLDTVWPDVAVGDAVLKGCIRELRDALGDDTAQPRYVETAHRRGYRFIGALKARGDEQSASRIEPVATRAQLQTTLADGAGALVGRAAELAALDSALGRARAGERQTVLVEGEPGAGKSALIGALTASASQAGLRLLVAQCIDQFGAGEPFMPVLEALDASYAADGDGVPLTAAVSMAGTAGALPAAGSAAGLVRALANAVEQLANPSGLVLVVEDLHWCDPSTLALLALLAQRSTPCSLCIVLTHRPALDTPEHAPLRSFVGELASRGRISRHVLSGLAPDAVRELLARRCPAGPHVPELAAVIHARTGGHALFVSALLDDLTTRGLLAAGPSPALVDHVHSQLPDRLGALIATQLGQLGAAQRRIVELLAVAAVPLSARAIATLLAEDTLSTETLCEALCRQPRVLCSEPRSMADDLAARYGLVHALVLDAAYALVPSERRRALHRRVAEHLGGVALEEVRELAHVLALHLERAGEPLRAAEACARAAEQSARRFAPREALLHAERGLLLMAATPRAAASDSIEVRLQLSRGNARMALNGAADPGLAATFERARALASDLDDASQRARALLGLQSYYGMRELAVSCELAGEVSQIAAATGDARLQSEAEMAHGLAEFYRGRLAPAEHHYEQAERGMAERLAGGDRAAEAERGSLLARRALVSQLLGQPDRALAQAEAALKVVQCRDDFAQRARVQVLASWLHMLRGEPAASLHEAQRGLAAAEADGLTYWAASALLMRGAARLMTGEAHAALDDLERGLSEWRRLGVVLLYPYFAAVHGAALVRLARVDEALELLERAEQQRVCGGEAVMASVILRLKAGWIMARQPDEAQAMLARAASLAAAQGAVQLQLAALNDLAVAAQRFERSALLRRTRSELRHVCLTLTGEHGFAELRAARSLLATRESQLPRVVRLPRQA